MSETLAPVLGEATVQELRDALRGELLQPGDEQYDEAKSDQGFIEGRIGEIEAKLSTAEVIDTASLNNTGKVIFGATVDLEDQDDGKRISYQIVGEDEADIKTGRISITSPIARAIVGKSKGDVVDVVAPGGKHSYEVMEVRYV